MVGDCHCSTEFAQPDSIGFQPQSTAELSADCKPQAARGFPGSHGPCRRMPAKGCPNVNRTGQGQAQWCPVDACRPPSRASEAHGKPRNCHRRASTPIHGRTDRRLRSTKPMPGSSQVEPGHDREKSHRPAGRDFVRLDQSPWPRLAKSQASGGVIAARSGSAAKPMPGTWSEAQSSMPSLTFRNTSSARRS
jgi:hypothetical protein